ncbi:MAG: hypothetical protein AB7F43_12550 [Bacteriovoracia bacterium]
MTNPTNEKPLQFVICDANVVIMMAIFNGSKMLEEGSYSFGELQIHDLAIEEIKRWRKSQAKLRKFGKDVINSAITKAEAAGFSLGEMAAAERTRFHSAISNIENGLDTDDKGMATSPEDKEYIALALKHGCYLASQEDTIRSVALKMLPEKSKLLSFEDLIVDLFKSGQLTKQDILDGIGNLNHFRENFRRDQKFKVNKILTQ